MADFIPSLEHAFKQFLASPEYRPMTRREICAALRLPDDRRRELRAVLRRLHAAGEVALLRKNRWARPDAGRCIRGTLSVHARGHGTIEDISRPGTMLQIDAADLRNAIHGDLVEAEPVAAGRDSGRRGRRFRVEPDSESARVTRVIDRRHPVLSGILKRTAYYWYVIPANPRFPQSVRVRETAAGVGMTDGHMAAIRLDPWSPTGTVTAGRLIEDLGRPGDPGVDMTALMRRHNLDPAHPADAMAEAAAASPAIRASDLDGRVDLRGELVLTIDPDDAKDFDDAVSLTRRTDGTWLLDVHIADVAHHVPPGHAIDREACARGTSVYLVDRTLPMLPHDLTTVVCSLQPDKDRLCHTIRLVVEPDGRVARDEIFRSVIRSRHRLDYDTVQRTLDDPGGGGGTPAEIRPLLRDMYALASTLRAVRMKAGALGFTLPEVKIELDGDGRVASIRRRAAVAAYSLIEEFMLLANRAAARRMARARVPALYRIHEPPDDAQWAGMAQALRDLGVSGFEPDAVSINRMIGRLSGTPLETPVAMAVLRHMKRAVYSPRRAGHFGLAFDDYTHFTSPIRRYPDLVTHRILCALESGAAPPYGHDRIAHIAEHSTRMERAADEAERESVALKRIEHYRALLDRGETGPCPALVVGEIPRGLLVEVVDTLQRGLVPSHFLRGPRMAGMRPGRVMDVEILRVDTHRKLVDFRPAADAAAPADRGRRRDRRAKRRQRIK